MFQRPAVTGASVLLAALLLTRLAAAEPFHYPEGVHGAGTLRYINGLPVLTVSGTPEEIGRAAGMLAVRPAKRVLDYPRALLEHFFAGLAWQPFVRAGNKMVEKFPADYRRELEALGDASGGEREGLVAGNTLFDLKKLFACSALLVEANASATGAPLLGRNLDYPSLGYLHEYTLVTVCRPTGARHAFAMVGFPGLVGCLSGMNDAGLAVAVLEVFQVKVGCKRFDRSGTPYALCYRRLLEECATIEEARALLEKMPRTTITNLAVADRQGVAVFEITPRQVQVRRAENGRCVCTNHFCTDELKPLVQVNLVRTLNRFKTLETAASEPLLGPAELQRGLHAASFRDRTLQAMIFEPATLRMQLAIGQCPATAGEFKVLDLLPLFDSLHDATEE